MCIDLHQTGSVGEGSDHLQLIKLWHSCAPQRVSAAGRNFLTPPYYSQCTVFASLWALFTLCAKLSGTVYCCRSCLCVCNGRASGVRPLLQPVRSVCVSLSAFFIHWCFNRLSGLTMSKYCWSLSCSASVCFIITGSQSGSCPTVCCSNLQEEHQASY